MGRVLTIRQRTYQAQDLRFPPDARAGGADFVEFALGQGPGDVPCLRVDRLRSLRTEAIRSRSENGPALEQWDSPLFAGGFDGGGEPPPSGLPGAPIPSVCCRTAQWAAQAFWTLGQVSNPES